MSELGDEMRSVDELRTRLTGHSLDLDALQLEVEQLVRPIIGQRLTCAIPWSNPAADPVADVRAMRGLIEPERPIVYQAGAGSYCGECGTPVCEHVARVRGTS